MEPIKYCSQAYSAEAYISANFDKFSIKQESQVMYKVQTLLGCISSTTEPNH
jgi:hypothetical protein